MQTEMFALFFHPSFCHNKASITRTRRTTMELFTVQKGHCHQRRGPGLSPGLLHSALCGSLFLFFCIFHLAKAPPGFIIELVPRCARTRCLEAEKEKRDYEINHQNPDGRPAGQADFAGQPAAGPVQPAAGTVQHVGRGRRGPVCRVHGAGCRGLHQHSGHSVHRLSHRPEQRHQRAGGTLLRGPPMCKRRCTRPPSSA